MSNEMQRDNYPIFFKLRWIQVLIQRGQVVKLQRTVKNFAYGVKNNWEYLMTYELEILIILKLGRVSKPVK